MDRFIRKIKHIRLQPIRVYCLHHVCTKFIPDSMNECDWMEIDEFKRSIHAMQKDGVNFISLEVAYHHICNDWYRWRRYAVLTFDDGYESLKEVLPWLKEQGIPVTLFINGKYTDGVSYRKTQKEKYLSIEDIYNLLGQQIEIGHHGWEHVQTDQMSIEAFTMSLVNNLSLLHAHPRYVPFYAYPYGNFTTSSDKVLKDRGIIPVYVDGLKNYDDVECIHREMLDKYDIK